MKLVKTTETTIITRTLWCPGTCTAELMKCVLSYRNSASHYSCTFVNNAENSRALLYHPNCHLKYLNAK